MVRHPGALTESGYPFIVKRLKRGQSLADAAEIYRGDISDGGYGVSPSVYRNGAGEVQAIIISRPLDTYRSETWRLTGGTAVKLNLPERVSIHGVQDGRLIVGLDQDWERGGFPVASGTLLSLSLADLAQPTMPPASPDSDPETIFKPTARQSVQDVAVLDDGLVVSIADNVVGTLRRFAFRATGRSGVRRPSPPPPTVQSASATCRAARAGCSSRARAS